MMRLVWISFSLWLLSGCSWFGNDALVTRLETGSSAPTEMPLGLATPGYVEMMPIPEIEDPRGLSEVDYTLRRPEPLSTRYGVDQIVIKKLDDEQWVFLDIPPSVVWPKVVQFWEANNLEVASADPATGILTSRWITAREGSAEDTFQSIRDGNVFRNTRNVNLHQFKLRMEPGVRSGSTELYIEQRQVAADAPYRLDNMVWEGASDDLALEREVLKGIAYYLGENISQGTMSMMASNLTEGRTRLIPDRYKPELRYKLDFNRAWATVGDALETANITVNDINRSEATYFVYYQPTHQVNPGFFRKIFSRGEKSQSAENLYQVRLENTDGEVLVTVLQGEGFADGLAAERLLKIIKEYST
ncbi:MAG: outer membrane protein assembly factor BamC [Pseudomonadales bacterium]